MGQKEYFTPEDYQWLESFLGPCGKNRTPLHLEIPDFDRAIFDNYILKTFYDLERFDVQLRYLYKFAHYQEENKIRLTSDQFVDLLEHILASDSDMPRYAQNYFEEQVMFYRHPKQQNALIPFTHIENMIGNTDPKIYRRLRDEVRTA